MLVAAGLGVTGAFLGTGLALAMLAAALFAILRPLLPDRPRWRAQDASRLRSLLAGAWAPVLGMTLLFALQEVHVIVVKHEATATAGRLLGRGRGGGQGHHLGGGGAGHVPAARGGPPRPHQGEDARPILARTLGLIVVIAVPMVLVYAVAAEPLLSAGVRARPDPGRRSTPAGWAWPWRCCPCAYLSVQYMLALGKARLHLGAGRRRRGRGGAAAGDRRRPEHHRARRCPACSSLCASALLALSFRSRSRIVSAARARQAEIA